MEEGASSWGEAGVHLREVASIDKVHLVIVTSFIKSLYF